MLKLLNQFRNDARGATAIEYAVIGAFLSILIVAGTRAIGTSLSSKFLGPVANGLS